MSHAAVRSMERVLKREWNRNWPFLVGFAITGALVTKLTVNLTEEDAKNSPFVQRHGRDAR